MFGFTQFATSTFGIIHLKVDLHDLYVIGDFTVLEILSYGDVILFCRISFTIILI